MGSIRNAFLPNRSVSRSTMLAIVVSQILFFLALWIVGAPKIIPRPLEILSAMGVLWQQGVATELFVSFKTNLIALFWTAVIALPLSYLTVTAFMRPVAEAVSKMRFLGLTGLTLIFTLVIGGGGVLKVSTIVFGMTVFTVTSLMAVVGSIPREAFDHARTLRMGEWRMVWEVVIRGKLDETFEIIRHNAAIGWVMLTMVEGLVRSEGGIGALLLTQNKFFNLAAVFAIQILILLVGLLIDWMIGSAKNLACPYANITRERR